MNIIDAIKSGLRYKRPDMTHWFEPDLQCSHLYLGRESILADDWEVQERQVIVSLTENQFYDMLREELIEECKDQRLQFPPYITPGYVCAKAMGRWWKKISGEK